MRIGFSSFVALLLAVASALQNAVAEETTDCLSNDEHFHIQDFKADGPRMADVIKMVERHVCRTTMMGLSVTVAHDPLIDGTFAPAYYTQTDAQSAAADWELVKKSYGTWAPLWQELGPALTRQVTKDNYIRIFDESRNNMRAWEKTHPNKFD